MCISVSRVCWQQRAPVQFNHPVYFNHHIFSLVILLWEFRFVISANRRLIQFADRNDIDSFFLSQAILMCCSILCTVDYIIQKNAHKSYQNISNGWLANRTFFDSYQTTNVNDRLLCKLHFQMIFSAEFPEKYFGRIEKCDRNTLKCSIVCRRYKCLLHFQQFFIPPSFPPGS